MSVFDKAGGPEPGIDELRKFGLVFGLLIVGFLGLLVPWLWSLDISPRKWPWPVGGVFVVWALVHPASLRPVYKAWMGFGHALGWVNSRVILGLMFYLVIAPMGLVMRLILRKDPMKRHYESAADTYRVASENTEIKRMEKPF